MSNYISRFNGGITVLEQSKSTAASTSSNKPTGTHLLSIPLMAGGMTWELHMVHKSTDPDVINKVTVIGLLYQIGPPDPFHSISRPKVFQVYRQATAL